jgi:hypothetical protein
LNGKILKEKKSFLLCPWQQRCYQLYQFLAQLVFLYFASAQSYVPQPQQQRQQAAQSGQTNTGAASPLKFFLKVVNNANAGTASAAAGQPQ